MICDLIVLNSKLLQKNNYFTISTHNNNYKIKHDNYKL